MANTSQQVTAALYYRKVRGNGATCQGCGEEIWGVKFGWYLGIEGVSDVVPVVGSRMCADCNKVFVKEMRKL